MVRSRRSALLVQVSTIVILFAVADPEERERCMPRCCWT